MAETGSLEYPARLHARGVPPVNAVVEYITPTTCRLRAVVLFAAGAAVGFDFGSGESVVHVSGKVAERRGNGPRFTYLVNLDAIEGVEALMVAVAQWRRKRDAHPAEVPVGPDDEGLKRAQVRVATQFPITFRTTLGDESSEARAADLSTGGLSLSSSEHLGEGRLLYLRFKLPSVPSAEGAAAAPFAEMQVSARVIWRRQIGPGLFTYGVVFFEIDAATRSEIKRYVDAVRHTPERDRSA